MLKRFGFTLFALIVYRLGTYIPIPGINLGVIGEIVSGHTTGVLGIFNVFSGGALGRMTIFALNVMPYIVSSIMVQLLSVAVPALNEMRQEGELGRAKINSYTRYLTVVFCIVQGLMILLGLERMNTAEVMVVLDPGLTFRVVGISSMLAGTMFLLWLGERINLKGIGNGISLIIFVGIISELPSSLSSVFMLGKRGELSGFAVFLVMASFLALFLLIIFFERSYRKVLVQYPKRQVGGRFYNSDSSYMPLKINISGVIPPIFANALLLSLMTLAKFSAGSSWSDFVLRYFHTESVLYVVVYVALIMFFTFFYTSLVFDSKETAEMLKKNSGFIPGKRPGKSTMEYFDQVIRRLTVIGAVYLSVVCVVPEVVRHYCAVSFTLGGTSFLIIVNVINDTFSQVQTQIYSGRYSALMKKSELWKKNR
ncbi:preprotein translocase, SecY subunit [Anaplasma phagocytophilum str. ApWI1]|uniref:Protein translocase subunit SecY n=1 Tax=Anaplasma phagocytophilum str. ApWI1 TaxID=1359155 RepID=A0A0F3PZ70_ANAPH|nr:preprotein translocase, SecY subunit [Anaplasma phagocytophilum str. Webster]KJV82904.1 preprotein translocase, SecY subunit [Anaplasma phagocytophilum str. HGE2]KJV85573.1 preprotein translocase, SecY subunit [Anaplasma phagocytophilum str. ApWI1]KJV99193.1 preprotein translocase, SecY subunit [Anaplasma phagocytophilum str. Annie]KJZ99313.1 preprotein translocase, SecY subunit [Anaplasma phagocytophilum str. CR1007]KJZ99941.1 preprotein translocase, SecY subunit [Anaplasma phagocytophilum